MSALPRVCPLLQMEENQGVEADKVLQLPDIASFLNVVDEMLPVIEPLTLPTFPPGPHLPVSRLLALNVCLQLSVLTERDCGTALVLWGTSVDPGKASAFLCIRLT